MSFFRRRKNQVGSQQPDLDDGVQIDLDVGSDDSLTLDLPASLGPSSSALAPDNRVEDQESAPHPMLMVIAERAMLQIQAEEIRRGARYGEEERMVLLKVAALPMIDAWLREEREQEASEDLQYEVSRGFREIGEQLTRISEQLDEPRDLVGRMLRFQREHPFLAGWIGADIINKLKKD